jgi:hypothetical protein
MRRKGYGPFVAEDHERIDDMENNLKWQVGAGVHDSDSQTIAQRDGRGSTVL